jgi:two-component system, OmpR family, alkaline phosphatase synthesis response regulator PhoP
MHRILVVSDNLRGAERLRAQLQSAGYQVTMAPSEEEDLARALQERTPDVILVDGSSVVKELGEVRRWLRPKRGPKEVATIVLLEEEDISRLDPGAGWSDFALVPLRSMELIARVRRLLWSLGKEDSTDTIRMDALMIDLRNYSVTLNGDPIELTYKEYQLLRFLATHPGRVFTRDDLLNQVWGYDYYGGTRTVDVHIRRIRAKLGSPYDALIQTVHNVGYRFK